MLCVYLLSWQNFRYFDTKFDTFIGLHDWFLLNYTWQSKNPVKKGRNPIHLHAHVRYCGLNLAGNCCLGNHHVHLSFYAFERCILTCFIILRSNNRNIFGHFPIWRQNRSKWRPFWIQFSAIIFYSFVCEMSQVHPITLILVSKCC